MKKCEYCNKEHNENYGSGRFCNFKCARGFSTKNKRKEINEKVSKTIIQNTLLKHPYEIIKICKFCKKEFKVIWNKKNKNFCSKSCSSKMITSSIEIRHILSLRAIKNNFGTKNRNKYSHGWYKSKFAGNVFLESKWEFIVAKYLDKNDIKWIRPKHFYWNDNKNIKRRYFPDFYLTEYDIYLDPKNDYLVTISKEKISSVIKENNINLIIITKNDISNLKLFFDKILNSPKAFIG